MNNSCEIMYMIIQILDISNTSKRMIKFAYNNCCGSYDLSDKGKELYNLLADKVNLENYTEFDSDGTTDPIYIEVVESLKDEAHDFCSPKIFEIEEKIVIKAGLNIHNLKDYGKLYDIITYPESPPDIYDYGSSSTKLPPDIYDYGSEPTDIYDYGSSSGIIHDE